jgi:septum formation protein
MTQIERIILASGSPRRRQLLEWAEIPFDVLVKETPETFPAGMATEEAPIHIARNKALAAREDIREARVILAADTVVVLDNEIIGKPRDRDDAVEILLRLAGREHRVITGVVLMRGSSEISFADTTAVWFHDLERKHIEQYVDRYKPYDKAGAYAIQEWIGVVGIRGISGDFYNVMGLPISRVVRQLALI